MRAGENVRVPTGACGTGGQIPKKKMSIRTRMWFTRHIVCAKKNFYIYIYNLRFDQITHT